MKLNKTMKKILSFALSLAMVVSTLSLNIVKADDEWLSTNNGWINFTTDGYVTGDVDRFGIEGISAIYAGVWNDNQHANIDVKRNTEDPYTLPIKVNDSTNNEEYLIQVAFNVQNLDASKVYQVDLKLDDTVLFSTTVSDATECKINKGYGTTGAFTEGEHTLKVEKKEVVKDDTPVEVQNITIVPDETNIKANRKIFASWTNPEGAAKTYAYLNEVKEENGVCTDGKGWIFNEKADQPMTKVDNVSRTQGDTDTIYVELGKTYTLIVVSYNAWGDKIGEGSIEITIPAKTQEEIDAENAIAALKAKLESDDNLAKGKEAFALSKETEIAHLTDGNNGTSWQADPKVENTTFGVNLGKVENISSVIINWQDANATDYEIYVAGADGVYGDKPVATVSGLENNKSAVVETKFDTVAAQYVKVVTTGWGGFAKDYGIRVWEFGVYEGTPAPDNTSTSTTTPSATNPSVTQPDASSADVTQPDASSADVTSPDASSADVTSPDASSADVTTADVTTVDVSTPDASTADVTTPDASTADETTTPKATTPKATTPKATTPKATTKKASLKQTKVTKKVTKKLSSKKVKLTFKKVKGAKKYTIQVSTSKKFKKILYKKTVKKTKVTLSSKKLKGKKKLYIRVKAVGAKKWSKPVKIKVKK